MGSVRLLGAVAAVVGFLGGQAQGQSACGVAPVVGINARPNIFSVQQEQWLGEAERDSTARRLRRRGSLNHGW